MNKKLLLTSTVFLSMVAGQHVKAETWTARSVDAIKADLVAAGNSQAYTVKYGDTLSTIAEAMAVDMEVLAKVNQIADLNLIFPEARITTTYDKKDQATEVVIEAPVADQAGETVEATIDLKAKEVTISDETVKLADVEATDDASIAASEPAPVTEAAQEEAAITDPVAPATVEQPAQPAVEAVSPVAEPTMPAPVTEGAATQTPVASGTVDSTGLQPQAAAFQQEVANLFGITEFSTLRPGDSGDHGQGLAVDFMVPVSSALGDQVAEYAANNMGTKNISYIIWKQRFYSPYPSIYGPAYTWNPMPDRGSVTENHYDHVHVSFNP
ncbi:LysM peptidoglycan-binding domain-containing protein [Streptococcus merionis]|uniref:LysM peptidoglycan-binding domain-containing protein n=1 Tax=Streptococcus merionis TaxID=400065 RepID=UPI003515AC3A